MVERGQPGTHGCGPGHKVPGWYLRKVGLRVAPCYKREMKTVQRWLLFEYVGREITPLSKPFKTRKLAEAERSKYPERQQKSIGVGMIRVEK